MSAARILRRPRAKADLVEHYSFIARDKILRVLHGARDLGAALRDADE